MGKNSDANRNKDVRDMQALATRKDGRRDAIAAAGELPPAAEVGVPAADVDVREVRAGSGEGDSGACSMAVPIRTNNGLNAREHWRARTRRVKTEREAVGWSVAGKKPPPVPCTVLLTRVGPSNGLDDDNLRGSLKGVRDEIAKWLGVDDRSPLVTWDYAQRRAKAWAVEVDVQPRRTSAVAACEACGGLGFTQRAA